MTELILFGDIEFGTTGSELMRWDKAGGLTGVKIRPIVKVFDVRG